MTTALLSEPEAAARLHISARLLRELRRQGHIRYVALSARRIAYRPEDCDEFVESRVRKVEPCPAPKPQPRSTKARSGRTADIITFSEMQAQRR